MSAVLHPTLPLEHGETPTSFASRLALFYQRPGAQVFASEVGLVYQRIVDGDAGELARLAKLTGAPADQLTQNAIVMDGRAGRFRGQFLLASSMQRTAVRICPCCIADDVQSSTLAPSLAAYSRSAWLIVHLRTCPIHGVRIMPAVDEARGQYDHDSAQLLAPRLPTIVATAAAEPRRDLSPLERYLLDRLDRRTGKTSWLDTLAFSAAARICEIIGAVILYGREVEIRQMTNDDWYDAGAAGFLVAADGEPAIRAWLAELQASYPYTFMAKERPQAIYGQFYKSIAFSQKHAIFEPIRELITRHVIDTMPLGPGDELFGKPIIERRLHSVRTASVEFGVHPKRLHKIVLDTGLAHPSMANEPYHRVLVDAKKMEAAIDAVVRGIAHRDVETYLNAGRVPTKILVDGGYLKPGDVGERSRGRFQLDTLDAFLARLTAEARPVDAALDGAYRLPDAAKRANCKLTEIVDLLLARKLKSVWKLSSDRGLLAILVDVDEIKTYVHGPALDGLTAREVEKDLKTATRVVVALLAHGQLRQVDAINPVNRCPIKIIPRADYERFKETYVSLFGLMRETGKHFRTLKARLTAAGVKPTLPAAIYYTDFYRRADIVGL